MRVLSKSQRVLFAPDRAKSVEPGDPPRAARPAPAGPGPALLRPVGDSPVPGKAKRRKPIPASALTKRLYESLGWRVAFVERFIAPIKRRLDMFGFADHVAYKPGQPGFRFINSCAVDRLADHVRTILANPRAYEILEMDPTNRITIVAWERGKPGKGNRHKVRHLQLHEFNGKPPEPVKQQRATNTPPAAEGAERGPHPFHDTGNYL